MGKKKRKRLAELETFSNVFQLRSDLKGRWNELVFKNPNPITLELACGKGEYTLALAKKFPDQNFIGIDIKGPRLWKGAKAAIEENISNAVFLRTFIDHVTDYFEQGEVEEIWITFPDPYREKSKSRKRLTSELFLPRYQNILKPSGIVHLKTDDLQLYLFSIEKIKDHGCVILHQIENLYASPSPNEILEVKTFYELKHLAQKKKIKYLSFQFKEK